MTKDEALDKALEFVEANHLGGQDAFELITAIKQARSAPVQDDLPDFIAGAFGVSRGTAYDMMREALEEASPVQEPVAGQPLPCPFCGHIGLDFSDGETYRWGVASCSGCGASCGEVRREYPDKSEWHTEAIAEWNRRSPAAKRRWVGLTDEDLANCSGHEVRWALYWEKLLKGKNT